MVGGMQPRPQAGLPIRRQLERGRALHRIEQQERYLHRHHGRTRT